MISEQVATYRTGQAAKMLGISSHKLRRLAETGLIDAELTASGQWNIPAAEVARLQAEGVPPIPSTIKREPDPEPETSRPPSRSRLAPAHVDEGDEADEARDARAAADAAEHTLRRRQVELQQAEIDDQFKERERRRLQAEEEARQRQAEKAEAEAHRKWVGDWITRGMKDLPWDLAPEIRAKIYKALETNLRTYSRSTPLTLVQSEVESTVATVLRPWNQARAVEQAVSFALIALPSAARNTPIEVQARNAARSAAMQADDLDQYSLRRIAEAAVRPLLDQLKQAAQAEQRRKSEEALRFIRNLDEDRAQTNRRNQRTQLLTSIDWWGSSAPDQLRKEAQAAMRQALQRLPESTSPEELRTSHRNVEQLYELALQALNHVPGYIARSDWEFNDWDEQQRLQRAVWNHVLAELRNENTSGRVSSGALSWLQIRPTVERFIEQWMDENSN